MQFRAIRAVGLRAEIIENPYVSREESVGEVARRLVIGVQNCTPGGKVEADKGLYRFESSGNVKGSS